MTLSRRNAWIALWFVALACFVLVAVPVYLIRPFAPQSPAGVALSFAFRRWSPLVTLAGAGLALGMAVLLWRRGRVFTRLASLLPLALVGMAAWSSRQPYFEWMFAPLPGPGFVAAGAAGFVEPGDMVLAVERAGDHAAYPVRQLAYHHLVQDSVGRVPIVATY
jgi:hypothetical protein